METRGVNIQIRVLIDHVARIIRAHLARMKVVGLQSKSGIPNEKSLLEHF